jgi:lipopolysaccharide export LptBFGC system permease protein LptF
VRALEVALYRKLALSVAAPPLVGLLLALAFRRRWGRGRLMAAAIATFAAYIVVDGAAQLFGARLGLPTLVIGWSATALCAVATVLITSSRSRARA